MNLKKFHDLLKNLYFMNPLGFQIFTIFSISIITLILFHLVFPPRIKSVEAPALATEATTFIPEHHSLIPIKLINQKSLGSLIGNFGWVDLYGVKRNAETYKRGPKIVKKIRLLRAPLDPTQFGIIVPNEFVDVILDFGPDYFATLNRNKFYKSELVIFKKPKRRVTYEDMY